MSKGFQSKLAECEALTSQIASAEVEKNCTLMEKITKLENQVSAQETTIKEQTEMMKSQALEFEQVAQKLLADKNADVEKLEAKVSDLREEVKARESNNDKLMELLHTKAAEFEKLTQDFEHECEVNKSGLQKNFEIDFQNQKQAFESEISALKSKLSDLEMQNTEHQNKSKTLYASLTDALQELTDYKKNLEELQCSTKRESLESSKELNDLQECHQRALREKEEESNNLKESIEKIEEENRRLKLELETVQSDDQVEKKIELIREECKKSTDAALAEQKSRYELRLKQVVETVKSQYKKEIEKNVTKWTSDFRAKDEKIADFKNKLDLAEREAENYKIEKTELAQKYEIAKQKISEISDHVEYKENLLSAENVKLSKKYEAAKKILLDLQDKLKNPH